MSKENLGIIQEVRWKDAWKEDECEYQVVIKYRKRGRSALLYPWDDYRLDKYNRNWKRYRYNQWKE